MIFIFAVVLGRVSLLMSAWKEGMAFVSVLDALWWCL